MNLKTKLTSRKLWAALAGVAVGLVVAFGGDAETIRTVAGSVMSVVSALVYILAEAGVDAAAARAAGESAGKTDAESAAEIPGDTPSGITD